MMKCFLCTGQVFLEFLNMGWPDVGKYKCVAENEHGKAEKIITVDVAGMKDSWK